MLAMPGDTKSERAEGWQANDAPLTPIRCIGSEAHVLNIHRGFKFKLCPTGEQETLFRQFSGVCRLVYNLALEQRVTWGRAHRINFATQCRELTALRAEFDWIAAVLQTCQTQALRDLDKAFANFFAGRARYPSPRKKGINDSFRFKAREITTRRLNGKWSAVRLQKIGWVKFRDTRAIRGSIRNATVSLASDGWYISFACEIEHQAPINLHPAVGIDRGVATTLALSTGEIISAPAAFAVIERKRRKAQQVLARRKRGSKRYARQRARVAKFHAKTGRIRRDWLHNASTDIAGRFGCVMIEDLNVRGMTASAKGTVSEPGRNTQQKAGLNRAILSQGWSVFATMLTYKLDERGGRLETVDPAYTSQTCSECGVIDRQSRESQASFVCRHCGHRDHADINAAKNILRRNTAFMDVEGMHWQPFEASTGGGRTLAENPHS